MEGILKGRGWLLKGRVRLWKGLLKVGGWLLKGSGLIFEG